ncbi:MAG: hypothetical protein OSB69_03775, partial [Alphaproteobacteria bacterium]|nr:hypothetical protein [Alphaproteobacteria bacterium]
MDAVNGVSKHFEGEVGLAAGAGLSKRFAKGSAKVSASRAGDSVALCGGSLSFASLSFASLSFASLSFASLS